MTTDEYNALVQRILHYDPKALDDVVKLCKRYYDNNPVGGALHIVLDDGNLKDSHVDWCEGYAHGLGDTEGNQLAGIIRTMSYAQRQKLYARYEEYS